MMGVKKTGDLLEKLTWGLAISVMVLALATNLTTPNTGSASDDLLDRAKDQVETPSPSLKKTDSSTSK